MTVGKKNKKNHGVKTKKPSIKVPRRTVGGGSVDVPAHVLHGWKEISGVDDDRRFARNAEKFRQLWRVFTTGREQISPELLQDPGAAEAYVTGFHLPNAARAALFCHRLAQRLGARDLGEWFGKHFTHQRVFDFGCGSAAWSQVWLSEVRLKRNTVHLVDASRALLDIATKGISSLRVNRQGTSSLYVETLCSGIDELNFAHFDLRQDPVESRLDHSLDVYVLGYVWNELNNDSAARARVMQRLESCVSNKSNALLVLAEPATDELAWGAMALRDELCRAGWVAVYPCPWGVVSCPMLAVKGGARDWCFSEGGWRKPEAYMRLEELSGIAHNKLNSSMYALASPRLARRLAEIAPAVLSHSQVVVGRPSVPGGRDAGFSYLLCTPHGLMKTVPKRIDPKFGKPRGSTVTSVARPAAVEGKAVKKQKRKGEPR